MAHTPKNNIFSSKKHKTQEINDRTSSETPKLSKTHSNREKSEDSAAFITPRRCDNSQIPVQTPKYYNQVKIETPISTKKVSKEKCGEVRNLTVAVRIRPLNSRELSTVGAKNVVSVRDNTLTIHAHNVGNISTSIDHGFSYDHVFWSCDKKTEHYADQEYVFTAIGEPLLANAFKGYNGCLFAYGQTGSGKSYSMMGTNSKCITDIDENTGIIPRFCQQLFTDIEELQPSCAVTVEVSYFEIYNEKIHDLLSLNSSANKTALKVREHPVLGPYVVDLSVQHVNSYKDLKDWLQLGNRNRSTAATMMNEMSSRSHSIFSLEICLMEQLNDNSSCKRSKVSLIDLAGSERLGQTNNTDEKMKQGVCINKSLLTLGKVIIALAEQKKSSQFIPYRESVLTWLLKESLGGNSLTCMLATITPSSSNIEETLATLRYACQARSIVNRARVNENPNDRLIRELRAEVERLRALRETYETNSVYSMDCLENTSDQCQLEELIKTKQKLYVTESKLADAQEKWEQQFLEMKQKQLKELAEAEKMKEELESNLRVMTNIDTNLDVSIYQSNFLNDLEEVLMGECTENVNKLMDKSGIVKCVSQIFELLSSLRPTVDSMDEDTKLSFARISKLLQSFEKTMITNLSKNNKEKIVTFNV